MILQPFPNIEGAQNWYATTKDGLVGLRLAASSGAKLSVETLDELYWMTEAEWREFYRKQSMRHEMFATLALFAACEGGIRRDFEWRCSGNIGQRHHQHFYNLQSAATRKHIPLSIILDSWKNAERNKDWFRKQINTLGDLFVQRNDLAHGRDGGNVAFEPVYHCLNTICQKWRDAVDDFRGY